MGGGLAPLRVMVDPAPAVVVPGDIREHKSVRPTVLRASCYRTRSPSACAESSCVRRTILRMVCNPLKRSAYALGREAADSVVEGGVRW